MYQGTRPPLNSVVKKKKNENLFLHGKSLLERTYPVMDARKTASNVPKNVTPIVTPVSYTHLDVYKRQIQVCGVMQGHLK